MKTRSESMKQSAIPGGKNRTMSSVRASGNSEAPDKTCIDRGVNQKEIAYVLVL